MVRRVAVPAKKELKEEIMNYVKENKELPIDLDGDTINYKNTLYYVNVFENAVYVIVRKVR